MGSIGITLEGSINLNKKDGKIIKSSFYMLMFYY